MMMPDGYDVGGKKKRKKEKKRGGGEGEDLWDMDR